MPFDDILKRYSSKIKDVYLELPNYKFYHSPLEESNPDTRFIGRKKLIEKLTLILENNRTETGTYLITGFRGMGKSSFVRKVIYQFTAKPPQVFPNTGFFSKGIINIFLWMFSILILSLIFHGTSFKILYGIIGLGICYLYVVKLVTSLHEKYANSTFYHFPVNDNRDQTFKPDQGFDNFVKSYVTEPSSTSYWMREEPFMYFQILLWVTICLITLLVPMITMDIGYGTILLANLVPLSVFILLKQIFIVYFSIKNFNKQNYNLSNSERVATYVPIEISIGQEGLRDRDILSAIVRELMRNMKKEYSIAKFHKPWMLLLIVILFICTFFSSPAISLRSDIYHHYELELITPSISYRNDSKLNTMYKEQWSEFLTDYSKLLTNYISYNYNRSWEPYEIKNTNIRWYDTPIINLLGYKTCFQLAQVDIFLSAFCKYNIYRLSSTFGEHNSLRISSFIPPYGFIFHMIFSFFIYFIVLKLIFILKKAACPIYQKLDHLDNRLFAAVSSTRGNDLAKQIWQMLPNLRSVFTTVQHPVANVKEIESELLVILHMMKDKWAQNKLSQYIIIIDEIDKVEAYSNQKLSEIEEETTAQSQVSETSNIVELTRKRRDAIFSLLSNLKHFFTTAKTKFFFIAGQEMFDASLADVSDRNFFLGSIFNQVINVESFYFDKSDNKSHSILTMTESYVCQFLLPEWYKDTLESQPYSTAYRFYAISDYRKYLEKNIFPLTYKSLDPSYLKINERESFGWKPSSTPFYPLLSKFVYNSKPYRTYLINRRKVDKIVALLQQFIVLLAYRSNGAPKKISAMFDEYITKFNKPDFANYFVAGKSPNSLYLRFGFYAQYNIGLINYLVNPLILPMSSAISDFNDKLLVSSSFLYDHILKFHKTGFSWQDLEIIPEFLDINKAPELRDMIQRIIMNLQGAHLESIQNGHINFVFSKNIVEEIRFLSKVVDREAAAFNFTLDESMPMKKHHYQKLKLLANQRSSNSGNDNSIFSGVDNSEIFTHILLGDLHFHDEEYEEALIQYRKAIQPIRYKEIPQQEITLFLTYIRCMLKIGLTYEKMNNFDQALGYYERASVDVVKFRDIELNKLRLKEVQIPSKHIEDTLKLSEYLNNFKYLKPELQNRLRHKLKLLRSGNLMQDYHVIVLQQKPQDYDEIYAVTIESQQYARLFKQSGMEPEEIKPYEELSSIFQEIQLPEIQKGDVIVGISGNFWHVLMQTEYTPQKEELLAKAALFENARLFFQPFLAKLHVLEKAYHGGIVLSDLNRVEKEFDYLGKVLRKAEEMYLPSEFWKKLGDLVFYKNPDFIQNANLSFNSSSQSENSKTILDINFELFSPFREFLLKPNAISTQCTICTTTSQRTRKACYACSIYAYNILHICRRYFVNDTICPTIPMTEFLFEIYGIILRNLSNDKDFKKFSPIEWSNLADSISALSDVLISCNTSWNGNSDIEINDMISKIKGLYDAEILTGKKLRTPFHTKILTQVCGLTNMISAAETCFLGFALSSLIARRCGNHRQEAFNLKKIIYLFRHFVQCDDASIEFVRKYVIKQAIDATYRIYSTTPRLEIAMQKDELIDFSVANPDEIDLRRISINAEIQEYVILLDNIQLKNISRILHSKMTDDMIRECIIKIIKIFPMHLISINDLATVSLIYDRILSLDFKSRLNALLLNLLQRIEKVADSELSNSLFVLFSEIFYPHGYLNVYSDLESYAIKEFLITDGIYCKTTILRQSNICGINYRMNHTFYANNYYHMGNWSEELYHLLYEYKENSFSHEEYQVKYNKLEKTLIRLLSDDAMEYLSPGYFFAKAQEHYKFAFDTHQGGEKYQQMIRSMFFLSEDFNSESYHFFTAIERGLLAKQSTLDKYDKIKQKLAGSALYHEEKYSVIEDHGNRDWPYR